MTLPVLFGANVDPVWQPLDGPLERTRHAERLGLDFVTVQDHPYQPAFHDTWTLLTFLAARTEHITLVPTVANLPLRPPAMLAKAAASLDLLSGGRLQLGLGAGAFWDAIAAMGGPRRSPGEAVQALEEGIDVIRAMWSGERSVRTSGQLYAVHGSHPGPQPGPGLGIGLGAYRKRTLALTGRMADGWMPSLGFLPPDRVGDASRRIDDAAADAGRDPTAIRKVYNLNGMIGTGSAEPFHGSADQWVEDIVTLVEGAGMNAFAYWPDGDHEAQIALFAEEVAPTVRAALPG